MRHARQGTTRGALAGRGHDLHETPPEAVRALLCAEHIEGPCWEPAAGRGAIVQVLREAGIATFASDLVRYAGADPTIRSGIDFLMESRAPEGCRTILTNPPFKLADQFVRHALTLAGTVIVLERLAWLESARRTDLFRNLWRVHLGIERLSAMHRDGWTGRKVKTATAPYGWFVLRQDSRPDVQPIALNRISWRGTA